MPVMVASPKTLQLMRIMIFTNGIIFGSAAALGGDSERAAVWIADTHHADLCQRWYWTLESIGSCA